MANYETEPTHNSRSMEIHISSKKIESLTSSNENIAETEKGPILGSCSLKRKRPPMLEIPNVLSEIVVDKELTSSRECGPLEDSVCFSDSGVGVFCLKGKKKFMEDSHKIVSCSNSKKGFFGVYDGHGGSKAAEFVAENLHTNIFKMMKNSSENASKEEAIKAGYMKTDQDFLEQGLGSGACCVTALIQDNEIVVSNVGDCRAVLCRGRKAEALTKDHRAGQEDERRRIEDKGGYVQHHRGAWRVHGILAVSRSIGDAHLKAWVPAEPDTTVLSLSQDMEFLVLASDGLWEEVGNQEAAEIITRACEGKRQSSEEAKSKENTSEYSSITMSPSPKVRRVLMVKSPSSRSKTTIQVPTAQTSEEAKSKENIDEYSSITMSPSSKFHRVLRVKIPSSKSKRTVQSPNIRKTKETRKGFEDNFPSENESPPLKAPRISLTNQMMMKTKYSNQEKHCFDRKPASGVLVSACKELVNLAIARGSLDDITVMIIDLNFFRE